jgi:hypothetical protein
MPTYQLTDRLKAVDEALKQMSANQPLPGQSEASFEYQQALLKILTGLREVVGELAKYKWSVGDIT